MDNAVLPEGFTCVEWQKAAERVSALTRECVQEPQEHRTTLAGWQREDAAMYAKARKLYSEEINALPERAVASLSNEEIETFLEEIS